VDYQENKKKELMATKCPVDELNEVMADLHTLDKLKQLKEQGD